MAVRVSSSGGSLRSLGIGVAADDGRGITLFSWVRQTNDSSPCRIGLTAGRSSGLRFMLGLDSAANNRRPRVIANTAGIVTAPTSLAIAANTWTPVGVAAALPGGSTGSYRFLAGTSLASSTNAPSGSQSLAADRMVVGRDDYSGFDAYYQGDYAHVAVWGCYLSDDELLALGRGANPLRVRRNRLLHYAPLDSDGRTRTATAATFGAYPGFSTEATDGPTVWVEGPRIAPPLRRRRWHLGALKSLGTTATGSATLTIVAGGPVAPAEAAKQGSATGALVLGGAAAETALERTGSATGSVLFGGAAATGAVEAAGGAALAVTLAGPDALAAAAKEGAAALATTLGGETAPSTAEKAAAAVLALLFGGPTAQGSTGKDVLGSAALTMLLGGPVATGVVVLPATAGPLRVKLSAWSGYLSISLTGSGGVMLCCDSTQAFRRFETVTVFVTVLDPTGQPYDATSMEMEARAPNGAVYTLTPQQLSGPGLWSASFTVEQTGAWAVRAWTTADGIPWVREYGFAVEESLFTAPAGEESVAGSLSFGGGPLTFGGSTLSFSSGAPIAWEDADTADALADAAFVVGVTDDAVPIKIPVALLAEAGGEEEPNQTTDQLPALASLTLTDNALAGRGTDLFRMTWQQVARFIYANPQVGFRKTISAALPVTLTDAHNGATVIVSGTGAISIDANAITSGWGVDVVNVNTAGNASFLFPNGGSLFGAGAPPVLEAGVSLRLGAYTVDGSLRFQASGGSGAGGGLQFAISAYTPPDAANGAAVTIAGRYQDEFISGVQYRDGEGGGWIDGTAPTAPPTGGSYSFSVPGLPQGYHTIYVRLTDQPDITAKTGQFAIGNAVTATPSKTSAPGGTYISFTGKVSFKPWSLSHAMQGYTGGGNNIATDMATVEAGGSWRTTGASYQLPAKEGDYVIALTATSQDYTKQAVALVPVTVTASPTAAVSMNPLNLNVHMKTQSLPITGFWGGSVQPTSIEIFRNNVWSVPGSLVIGADKTWSAVMPADAALGNGTYYGMHSRSKNSSGVVLATSNNNQHAGVG